MGHLDRQMYLESGASLHSELWHASLYRKIRIEDREELF